MSNCVFTERFPSPLEMLFICQQKESVMLNRTFLLLVLAVAAFTPPLFSTAVTASEKEFTLSGERSVILGQDSSQKNPTLMDRLRSGWNKLTQDDDSTHRHDHRVVQPIQPAVPTQPPKPLTTAEVQQSATLSAPPQQRIPAASQPRSGTALSVPRDVQDDGSEETEVSPLERMRSYREPVFKDPALQKAASVSRKMESTARTALIPSPVANFPVYPELEDGESSGGFAEPPVTLRTPTAMEERLEKMSDTAENLQPIPRNDQVLPNPTPASVSPTAQTVNRFNAVETEQRERETEKRLVVSVNPVLEVEVEQPMSAGVGQELTYRIRVTNIGNAPAEQVVLTTEIPSWVDVRQTDASNGKPMLLPREDGSGISDLTWRISRIDSGAADLLIVRLVPQTRRSIELVFLQDFYRPPIAAKVEVQEPKLELELLGSDEVLWNDLVVYTLLVRNTGNGDAENLKLTLLQTNSEAAQCEFGDPLKPGEEQPISISVQAGKEQEYLDIAVLAVGSHDLRGEIKRRVKVLRPKLEMSVQTPARHFVDSPEDFTIRIRNVGTADAENINIRAELPLGAQYRASSEGGVFTTQQQQSIVEWRAQSIMRGETLTYVLTCVPKREGECRVSVEANDPSGTVLAAGNGIFTAEAVTELELAILKPRGQIELGQEVEYTIQVTNTGTKVAENIEVSMAFGWKSPQEPVAVLEPIAVLGGEASQNNGLVIFDKIPVVLPKQCLELKVVVKAEQTGTVQVKTQVNGTDIHLENGLSATVFSRQKGPATASGPTQNEFK